MIFINSAIIDNNSPSFLYVIIYFCPFNCSKSDKILYETFLTKNNITFKDLF